MIQSSSQTSQTPLLTVVAEMVALPGREAALRQAIALRPAYAEAWNNLGNVLQGQRRHEEALAAYGEILRHLPPRLRPPSAR